MKIEISKTIYEYASNRNKFIIKTGDNIGILTHILGSLPEVCRVTPKVKEAFLNAVDEVEKMKFEVGDKVVGIGAGGGEEAETINAAKKLYHPFPQVGDIYYTVDISLLEKKAIVSGFKYDNCQIDRIYRIIGNFYKLKEEAQVVADKLNNIFKKNKEK